MTFVFGVGAQLLVPAIAAFLAEPDPDGYSPHAGRDPRTMSAHE
jgi:hypothetical protein